MKKLLDSFRGKEKGNHSSFWFNEGYYDTLYKGKETQTGLVESMRLAGFKRSCANFVHIMTGKNIPVRFATSDTSYTDYKSVVISGDVQDNFDSTVGLALHESSHIIYTDSTLKRQIVEDMSVWLKYLPDKLLKLAAKNIVGFNDWSRQTFVSPKSFDDWKPWFSTRDYEILFNLFNGLQNWIEDRRIDELSYKAAPGYRPYYSALYTRYWDSPMVDQMVASDMYRSESVDSYCQRIKGILNKNHDPMALKGLKEIEELIDIRNILRLKSTSDVYKVTAAVIKVILKNATKWSDLEEKNDKFEKGEASEEFGSPDLNPDPQQQDIEGQGEILEMTPEELAELIKALKEISDLENGTVQKVILDADIEKKIQVMVTSNASIAQATGDELGGRKVNVLLIKNLSDDIVFGNLPEFESVFFKSNGKPSHYYGRSDRDSMNEAVQRGLVFGHSLGRKLQIRNEERSLKFTRQMSGRVDRRLIADLGFNSPAIFQRIETDVFGSAHVHLSIDASGSMAGTKIEKSVETATAIAKACTMVKGLECVISFRTTLKNSTPVVLIAYDSRVNKLTHLKRYFPMIDAAGSTPESLCFEIMKSVFPVMNKVEQFLFVNISDGAPGWRGQEDCTNESNDQFLFTGDEAVRHCKRTVRDLQTLNGATILSYFVDEGSGTDFPTFKDMYGEGNSFSITDAGITQIARTLNKKFLEASSMRKFNY